MKPTIIELREERDRIFNEGRNFSNRIAEKMKLIDAGETSTLVSEALSAIEILNRKTEEPKWKSMARKLLPFGLVETAEQKIIKTTAESSSINDVVEKLISAVTLKRETVEGIVGDLHDLFENMEKSSVSLIEYKDNLELLISNESEFSKKEMFLMKNIKAETLEQISIIQENLVHCRNTIQAGEVSVRQIAALQPKLEAQLKDGMSIMVALEQLSQLTETCDGINEMCEIVRKENRENAYKAQMSALERQLSNGKATENLKLTLQRSVELNGQLLSLQQKVEAQTETQIKTLEDIHHKFQENLSDDISRDIGAKRLGR